MAGALVILSVVALLADLDRQLSMIVRRGEIRG
jgi:hypothetical protein